MKRIMLAIMLVVALAGVAFGQVGTNCYNPPPECPTVKVECVFPDNFTMQTVWTPEEGYWVAVQGTNEQCGTLEWAPGMARLTAL